MLAAAALRLSVHSADIIPTVLPCLTTLSPEGQRVAQPLLVCQTIGICCRTCTGIVDDFAVWRRALSASEVAALVASTVQLAPKPAVSFVTVDLRRSGAGKEAGAVQVTPMGCTSFLPMF